MTSSLFQQFIIFLERNVNFLMTHWWCLWYHGTHFISFFNTLSDAVKLPKFALKFGGLNCRNAHFNSSEVAYFVHKLTASCLVGSLLLEDAHSLKVVLLTKDRQTVEINIRIPLTSEKRILYFTLRGLEQPYLSWYCFRQILMRFWKRRLY